MLFEFLEAPRNQRTIESELEARASQSDDKNDQGMVTRISGSFFSVAHSNFREALRLGQ
jgi:hypothetical protein